MNFAMVEKPADLASYLRALEQNAAKTTAKEIRAVLIEAAKEIEDWRDAALSHARTLEEAARLKIGQVDSQSKADEVSRQVRNALLQTASDLRARLAR